MIDQSEFERIKANFTYEDFLRVADLFLKKAVEESLRALPHAMDHLTKNAITLKDLSDKFYKNNRDLAGHKELVTKVMEELEGSNPGMDFNELVSRLGPVVRERLTDQRVNQPIKAPSLKDLDSRLSGSDYGKL